MAFIILAVSYEIASAQLSSVHLLANNFSSQVIYVGTFEKIEKSPPASRIRYESNSKFTVLLAYSDK